MKHMYLRNLIINFLLLICITSSSFYYKKIDKKFKDIYVNDISNRLVTVEFDDGTFETLDFNGF